MIATIVVVVTPRGSIGIFRLLRMSGVYHVDLVKRNFFKAMREDLSWMIAVLREHATCVNRWIMMIGGPLTVLVMLIVCSRFIFSKNRVPGVGTLVSLEIFQWSTDFIRVYLFL